MSTEYAPNYTGDIATYCPYSDLADDIQEMERAEGAPAPLSFYLYGHAGRAFVDHILPQLEGAPVAVTTSQEDEGDEKSTPDNSPNSDALSPMEEERSAADDGLDSDVDVSTPDDGLDSDVTSP